MLAMSLWNEDGKTEIQLVDDAGEADFMRQVEHYKARCATVHGRGWRYREPGWRVCELDGDPGAIFTGHRPAPPLPKAWYEILCEDP